MDLKKIGLFIAEMRKKKKMTQQELADKLGVTDRAVSNWENGRRMPDVSIYKSLCSELNITLNELVNGELDTKEITQDNIDNTIIKTLDYNEKNKSKLYNIIKILVVILIISVTFIGITFYSFRKRFPKIDLYSIKLIENQDKVFIDQLIGTKDKFGYYSLDAVFLCDKNEKCYELRSSLVYKQITRNKLINFLNTQYKNNYLKKIESDQSNAIIFRNDSYEVIVCDEDNGYLYFGKNNIETSLEGYVCNKTSKIKEFTRTYKIESVKQDNDEKNIYVSLSQYQSDIVLVKIPNQFKLEVGKNYEFKFNTYETFDDTIGEIFNNSTIIEVKQTNKLGMEQIQEPIK